MTILIRKYISVGLLNVIEILGILEFLYGEYMISQNAVQGLILQVLDILKVEI